MGKEQENFLKEVILNRQVYKWVEKKLEDICRMHNVVVPEDTKWGLCIFQETEQGEDVFCQKEFEDKAVGFQINYLSGQVRAVSVFLDFDGKYRIIKKVGNRKEYYDEIIYGQDVEKS